MPARLIQGKQIESVSASASGAQVQSNRSATVAPTAGDDASLGYEVGSYWVNVTADTYYVCVDNTTGSAVWLMLQSASFTLACFEERITLLTAVTTDVTITGALANQPADAACVWLFINGVFQEQGAGEDYTLSGATDQDVDFLAGTGTLVDLDTADSIKVKYLG